MSVSYGTNLASVSSRESIVPRLVYRPDIDGLRAVAVLAVVGIHFGLPIRGGVAGVDIFFVISGYLISGLIFRALAEGRFSCLDFYVRRIKRLFPALIVLLVTMPVLGWIVLLPDEFRLLGKDMATGAGFVLNLTQQWHAIYHPNFVGVTTLIHLWSLGVEEQFYLFWPLFLLMTWRLAKGRLATILLATTLSFAVNILVVTYGRPWEAYVAPWTRLWELSLGSALACAQLDHAREGARNFVTRSWQPLISHSSAVLGTILLISSLALPIDSSTFPGWTALLPCLGTALVIAAGPDGWVNKYVLRAPPMVAIGIISYPLYLLHFPVAMLVLSPGQPATPSMIAGGIVASFVLAFLTYKYVELPVRSSSDSRRVAISLCAVMASCALIGCMIYLQVVPPRSPSAAVVRFLGAPEDWLSRSTSWTVGEGRFHKLGNRSRHVLYVGDSSMEQYYPRISKVLAENVSNTHDAIFAVGYGCAPVTVELEPLDDATRTACRRHLQMAFQYARDPAVDTIVLSARWSFALGSGPRSLKIGSDRALDHLRQSIDSLVSAGKVVYLVLSPPIAERPRQMIRRIGFSPGFQLAVRQPSKADVAKMLDPIESELRRIALKAGARIIDPKASLCGHQVCSVVSQQGESVYLDPWHLRPSYVRDHADFLDETVLDQRSP